MSAQPGSRPSLDLRGAVDLSSLGSQSAPPTGGAAAGPSDFVIEVSDATFTELVMQRSESIPVVLDFWAEWCGPCKQLSPVLIKLANEFNGQLLLATIDVDANPQLATAFQVQSIPSVYAMVKGQPVPLFQGAQPEAQIRQVLTELLRVAAANGVNGRLEATTDAEAPADEEEPELPAHHQAAYDAIEAGDLDAAIEAYRMALAEDPADEMARLGLAQTQLMQRASGVDQAKARQDAAAAPDDVDAQLVVADLDILGGHVEDAFSRLIDTVRVTSGADRDRVRTHLIELFDVVGADDPRVPPARLKLANALF